MSRRYDVREIRVEDHRVIELIDDGLGQRACVLPDVGATCFRYEVTHRGEVVQLLDLPPDMESLAGSPIHYGTPILFPFPNRIRRGRWSFRGREYQFSDLRDEGHALHGFVYNRPWHVDDMQVTDSWASCRLSLDYADCPDTHEQYPFPFRIVVVYSVSSDGLGIQLEVANVGNETLPMGLGIHPYFRAPIGPHTSRDACRVTVPASSYWALEDLIPTGELRPVFGNLDLRSGRLVEGLELDDVFSDLVLDGDVSRCAISDEVLGLTTELVSDRVFREMVVYTVPNRPSVCIEPYTCPTDCPNLSAHGIDAGLILLEAGTVLAGKALVRGVG